MVDVLDISGNQPLAINPKQIQADGTQAIWAKATEGVNYVDAHFASYRDNILQNSSMLFSAYHYLRVRPDGTAQDGEAQAVGFLKQYYSIPAERRLPAMFDVEQMENEQGSHEGWLGVTRQFRHVCENELPRLPLLYTDEGEWNMTGLQAYPEFADFELWVANIGASKPAIPKPWTTYRLWQYTWSAQVPGIAANVDGSHFNGISLRAWAGLGIGGKTAKIGMAIGAGLIASRLWDWAKR